MATTFCTQCGAKHEYAGFAPNFCSKCGANIGGKVKPTAEKASPRSRIESDMGDDEENTDVQELPDLDKLEVDIEIDGGFRAFSLEELSKTPNTAQTKKFVSKRLSGIDGLSPTKYGSTKD